MVCSRAIRTCAPIYALGVLASVFLAFILGLEQMRAGGSFVQVDFEMGPEASRLLLHELGATLEEIRAVAHFEPDGPPDTDDIAAICALPTPLVVIDAAAGAYHASALDDTIRKDAERFADTWVNPFWRNAVETLTIDHVVKNVEARGKYAIGSERKIGAADVHLGLEAITPLSRGGIGLVKIVTHRDRPGHLPRPRAADLELRSDPTTHAITWQFKPATSMSETANTWRPTALMLRVSEYLAAQSEPVTRNRVEDHVTGQATYVRRAIDELIAADHVEETPGPRKSRLLTLRQPFTASDAVATQSDTIASSRDSATASSLYKTQSKPTQSNQHR